MSVGIDKLASELQKVIEEKDKNKKTPYDTEAEVVRVDTEVVWVKIPGGVDETPVQKTVNAKVGDIVQVRVSGGRAFLVGNGTNPPTDDTVAHEASYQAQNAQVHAVNAEAAAADAQKSAESARIDASVAHQMAENATKSAGKANEQAEIAYGAASNSLLQLSYVENIVGVLDLLQKNGDYELTSDLEVVQDKWYFSRRGSGTTDDPYIYEIVQNPSDSPAKQDWYELVGIDRAIQNYVSSHLALTKDGLWLQNGTNSDATRVLLSSTDGILLYDKNGMIAKYGPKTQIGNQNGFHIEIDGSELGFFDKDVRVAYLNNQQLYITKSVVLQQMDLGRIYGSVDPITGEVGKGQWTWRVHPNGESPSRNNLNLKWIG